MNLPEDFFIEESINVISHDELESLELPLSRRTFALVLWVVAIICVTVFTRLAFLSLGKGGFYTLRAEANAGKVIGLPAPRGIIYDRFNNPLVENVPTFSVSVKAAHALEAARALGIPEAEVLKQLQGIDLEQSASIVIARDIDPDKAIQLKSLNIEGMEIVDDYRRHYQDGEIFSHIVGYTGFGDHNEITGKSGLEAYYDELLRGHDGEQVAYRDAHGEVIDKKLTREAIAGNNIYTTIDGDLQRFFYSALQSQLASLGRRAGVGIALDPRDGSVLALVSLPSFDNNVFNTPGMDAERKKILLSSFNPLFNRAISGAYTPGSVIKPVVAVAALKEGVVTTTDQVFSAGFIEIPNPYFPDKPSRFLDWKPHGWVDIYSALARSSNIYFYAAGGGLGNIKGLGIERLKEYWQKFGLGQKTGIDLTSENSGFLPDPEYKERKTGEIWRIGDTYNVTIGQGDLMVTPLQIITQIASIANGGKFFQPHVMQTAKSTDNRIVQTNDAKVNIDNSVLEPYFVEVRKGMRDAVQKPYGTAHMLNVLPVAISGKTGSAQIANNTKTNAFFVGYMPSDQPQIALLILIEDAREGSLNAVPVAETVLNWYYQNRIASTTLNR